MNTPPRAIHAIPVDRPAGRDHEPYTSCWCQPVEGFADLATMAPVYIHRARFVVGAPAPRATNDNPTKGDL